jgi:hypothetical protein
MQSSNQAYSQPTKYAGELRMFHEKLPHLLEWASFLIQSDEIEAAEHLLFKGMPGYYRNHPPKEVVQLRRYLYLFLMNTADYATNREDNTLCDVEKAISIVKHVQRGNLLFEEVLNSNKSGKIPHIFDMGPGDYWLPIGLKGLGLKFTYQASYLSQSAYDKQTESFKELLGIPSPESPSIFVANELIEHLRSPYEIVHCAYKHRLDPDQIHLSTPLNTFAEGCDGPWDSVSNLGRGGHLRTYTQNEFIDCVQGMFPGYTWTYYPGAVQSIIGRK